jgi:hypothetical protein
VVQPPGKYGNIDNGTDSSVKIASCYCRLGGDADVLMRDHHLDHCSENNNATTDRQPLEGNQECRCNWRLVLKNRKLGFVVLGNHEQV